MRAWIIGSLLCASACVVNPNDFAGRGCDADGDCLDGRICRSQRCVDPLTATGSCVVWRQTDGFSSSSACPACSVTVNGQSANTVDATIAGGNADQAFAFERFEGSVLSSLGAQGKMRGRVFVPSERHLNGTAAFLRLEGESQVGLIDLTFNNNYALRALSDANTLAPTALGTAFSSARFAPGAVYTIEVSWKQGDARVVRVYDTEVLRVAVPAGSAPHPSAFRLGILNNPGGSNEGWQDSLSDWQLCNDPAGSWE